MSIGEFADWHVGRYVGKSVSPQTAIYNWRTRFIHWLQYEDDPYRSAGKWVMSRPFSTLLSTGGGGVVGVVLRKTSAPLIVSPWLYKVMNSPCGMARNSGLDIFHIQKIAHWMHWISFKEDLFRWQKNWIWPELVGNPIKQTNLVICVCMYSMFTKHYTYPVSNYSTIINSPIYLNEQIKEISTGAPFSKFRRNVLY